MGCLQGEATVNFLAGVSVGHSQGAATANFLAGVSVGRSQGAANAFRWKAFRLMRPHAFLVSVL